jgi:catechol-2,3-dioxygenase
MKIAEEAPFGIFFRFNDYHHDIAVFKTAPDADLPKKDQVGLVHVALVADSVQTVKDMYERCKEMGVPIESTMDHGMTKSLYITDPEGNTIEIYAEVPEFNYLEQSFVNATQPFDFEMVTARA